MTGSLALICVTIVLLLMMSGFFSGSETALTATSRARMHKLEKDGVRKASAVNKLIDNRERLIGAILLGNNLVNILASALATTAFLQLFGDAGVAWATLVMTTLVLIFAEVLPKTYAISTPDRMAMAVSPFIRIFVAVFAPIVSAVQFIVRGVLKLVGVNTDELGDVLSAQEEIRGAIELHHEEGAVVKDARDMLGGVLDLSDIRIDDIMVHRKSIEMLDIELPAAELISKALESAHTRLPLWRNDPENIVGVLHAKDLSRAMLEVKGDIDAIDISALAREPWFVPETSSVKEQLDAFQKEKAHFALVVDEYGALMGLVTLEDVLEEIVGEIEDEHDIAVTGVRPQPGGAVNVDGDVTIRDLNRAMNWSLPDDEAVTIAGLVIHEAQAIPEPGQVFLFHGFKYEILRRHRNQITAMRITPEAPAA